MRAQARACVVRYSRCRNRARVGLSVGISVTVSVPSNKVRIVIVLTKKVVKIISLVRRKVSRKLVALVSSESG